MAFARPARVVDISVALTLLEPLGPDQYFIAFGPAGRQFCGTPNGYSATQLPARVVSDLVNGQVRKVVWASFGSDPSSYFFAYDMKSGSPGHRSGSRIPKTLRPFLDFASTVSLDLASSLRVQLGAKGSYVAWTSDMWMCQKVPTSLSEALCRFSSKYTEHDLGCKGALRCGALSNVTWNDNGSFYMKGNGHSWHFETDILQHGWEKLWRGHEQLTPRELETIAYVGIDPHSGTDGTFAFIKKKQPGVEPDFVVHFEPEAVIARLQPLNDLGVCGMSIPTHQSHREPAGPRQVVHVVSDTGGPQTYRWAYSIRTGKSHPTDSWELDLKKGERLKILQVMGKDWYIVQNQRGMNGYAHDSWLDIKETRTLADPQQAYARWTEDIEKLLKPGAVRSFPKLSKYIDMCVKEACKSLKQGTLGICAHDLHEVLRGSGQYSLDYLRAERNKWHPDRFARFCHPEHRDGLLSTAGALFVLFGVLMDWLGSPPINGGAG